MLQSGKKRTAWFNAATVTNNSDRVPTHLESQGINLIRESQGILLVGGQGILVACERKRRFLSTFQGKVATR